MLPEIYIIYTYLYKLATDVCYKNKDEGELIKLLFPFYFFVFVAGI